MSNAVEELEDFIGDTWDAVVGFTEDVWDDVINPILEPVFGILGIEDEKVLSVAHFSSKLFSNSPADPVETAKQHAIMTAITQKQDFFPNYMQKIYQPKAMMTAFYNFAATGGYIDGLPTAFIGSDYANDGQFAAIRNALELEKGGPCTIYAINTEFPTAERWSKDFMQTYNNLNYKYWLNTYTDNDQWGVQRTDWQWTSIAFSIPQNAYRVIGTRTGVEAKFWIEGPKQITEGDSATYTVKSNRPIPSGGLDMPLTIAISGTAVAGTDYSGNAVRTVNMPAGASTVDFTIDTLETGNANRTMDVALSVVVNTGGIFEIVTIHTPSSVNTTITDDDTLRLTVNDVLVTEANTTITLNVVCEAAAPSGAFSVDYAFTDLGTIVGGTDYDNTPGTLNFTGAAGNTQQISIDIYADVVDDDKEQFEVFFTNLQASGDNIDISVKSTVTIFDGSSDPAPGSAQTTVTTTLTNYTPEKTLYVIYTLDSDPPGQQRIWTYLFSSGTYPGIATGISRITNMEMMPTVTYRYNKTNVSSIGGQRWDDVKKISTLLGLDAVELTNAINANPDIDDVDDAYLFFGVSPQDNQQIVSKILWETFYQLLVEFGLNQEFRTVLVEDIVGNQYETINKDFFFTFKDGPAFPLWVINRACVWRTHEYVLGKTGVVANVGEFDHLVWGGVNGYSNLSIRLQKAANEYDEITLFDMYAFASIEYDDIDDTAFTNLGDVHMTIPLSKFIYDKLTPFEQLQATRWCARLELHAAVITHIEWYETESFFSVVEVVVLFLSIVYFDWSGTWYQIVLEFLKQYAINYAIGELLIWIVEQTGNEALAALVAVVAAVYLNDPSSFDPNTLLEAEVLLDLSTDFVDNLAYIEGQQNEEMLEDIQEATAEAEQRVKDEIKRRNDIEPVRDNSEFLAYLQSVDTTGYPARDAQYNYDLLFDYDTLVGNFVDNRLKIGVT